MKLTIFTPTFNRPQLLIGLYDSICDAYKFANIVDCLEWLIIDDGSNISYDNVISSFNDEYFSITYKKRITVGNIQHLIWP